MGLPDRENYKELGCIVLEVYAFQNRRWPADRLYPAYPFFFLKKDFTLRSARKNHWREESFFLDHGSSSVMPSILPMVKLVPENAAQKIKSTVDRSGVDFC